MNSKRKRTLPRTTTKKRMRLARTEDKTMIGKEGSKQRKN